MRTAGLVDCALAGVAAGASLAASGRHRRRRKEQFFPLLVYRTGAYRPNGMPWANGNADYLKLINARDGGDQRRQDHLRGVRDRLRHRPRRRVLRAAEGQGPTGATLPPAVHRHHLRAHRQGARRQDPADHRWATAAPTRSDGTRVRLEFPAARHLLGRRRHPGAARRQEGRRLASSRARRSRSSTTTRRTARSRSRCWRSAPRCTASSCCCCR